MFEKVAGVQTVRPPWLRPWGVSASAAAHVVIVLGVAAIPLPPRDLPRTVEETTFLVLLQAPRVPERLARLLAGTEQAAAATPQEPGSGLEGDGGETGPSVADLRLALAGHPAAVPEIEPVAPAFDRTVEQQALAAAARALSRGPRGRALLGGDAVADSGVVSAELLAEPPRMVNQGEITRLLVRLYPRQLRSMGVQGDVTLTFIIGVDGRVEMRSVKVLSSAHPDLTEPTLRALAAMRFRPARVSGKVVRVRATLPVRWVLQGWIAQAP